MTVYFNILEAGWNASTAVYGQHLENRVVHKKIKAFVIINLANID